MSDELSKDGLLSHLVDLRSCLLHCIFAVVGLIFLFFPVAGHIYATLAAPLLEALPSEEMVAIGVLTPFTVRLVTAALSAVLVALPYLWYEIWKFVAPGLYKNEKKLIMPLIISSTLLFYTGMAFAYLMVFKVVFAFIVSMGFEGMVWMPDIENFFSFAVTLFIAFGVAFETPVAVYLLVRAGLVEIDTLRRGRRYFIVGAFVVAAIFTPPDIISQLMLAIPCWLLFELGLFLAPKKKNKSTENKVGKEEN